MSDAARLDLNARARGAPAAPTVPVFDARAAAAAQQTVSRWPGYAPTRLHGLSHWARGLDVASLTVKHEGSRFGVGSFKALGPPYALAREIERRRAAGAAGPFTAVAATSGNHGRALSWGAARLGCAARIFMPAHTSAGREAAIRARGAEVVRVPGDFTAALDAAIAEAAKDNHILVADVPFAGRDDVARDTVAGYSVLGGEILDQCRGALPTHIFVAAGIGSLVAATVARLRLALGRTGPKVIAVEPLSSDTVRRSIVAGAPVAIAGEARSLMDGLVVDVVSPVVWPTLREGLDAALAIADVQALATLRDAALGRHGDAPLEIGETGIAALAGAVLAARDPALRAALGIGPDSRILAVACEGVTDRAVFEALVHGEAAGAVA